MVEFEQLRLLQHVCQRLFSWPTKVKWDMDPRGRWGNNGFRLRFDDGHDGFDMRTVSDCWVGDVGKQLEPTGLSSLNASSLSRSDRVSHKKVDSTNLIGWSQYHLDHDLAHEYRVCHGHNGRRIFGNWLVFTELSQPYSTLSTHSRPLYNSRVVEYHPLWVVLLGVAVLGRRYVRLLCSGSRSVFRGAKSVFHISLSRL